MNDHEPNDGMGQGIESFPVRVWDWPEADQERLIKTVYHGDRERYRRRVAWGRDTTEGAAKAESEIEASHWKEWFIRLDWTACLSKDDSNCLGEAAFLPFLQPLLVRARLEVAPLFAKLCPMVCSSLLDMLLRRLLGIGHRAIYEAFDQWRVAVGRASFGAFLEIWIESLGKEFFTVEKPYLGRWAQLVCQQWGRLVGDLFQRLNEDRPILEQIFGYPISGEALTGISGGDSDAHESGTMVMLLHFSGGGSLVYKPRGVQMEMALAEYASEVVSLDERLRITTTKVVPGRCGDHGWSRLVTTPDEWTGEALHNYYKQAGALLFQAALLGGRDLHMENVIASSEGPVLVDAECLLQPRQDGLGAGAGTMGRAVRDTGLLGESGAGRDNEATEIGGFVGEGDHMLPVLGVDYEDINTLKMRAVEVHRFSPRMANLPRSGAVPHRMRDHLEAVCEGFASAWHAAMEHRSGLSEALTVFDGLRTRFISRPTNQYGAVILAMIQPDALSCSRSRAVALEQLICEAFRVNSSPPPVDLIRAEMGSLLQLDVPVFHAPVDGLNLMCGQEVCVDSAFLHSGARAAGERLRALDYPGLEACLGVIRLLVVDGPERVKAGQRIEIPTMVGKVPEDPLMTIVRQLAVQVLDRLDGIELSKLNGVPDLYYGEPGTALFLAAAGACTLDKKLSEKSVGLMERALKRWRQGPNGLGAITGRGSMVLSLAALTRISGDAKWLNNAVQLGQAVSLDMLRRETEKDLLAGLAGWVAVIAEIIRSYPETLVELRPALDAAVCVLMETAEKGPDSVTQWRGADGLVMTGGLAHGASGVALALARAANVLRNRAFGEAAIAAIVAEDRAYNAELANWVFQINSLGQRLGMNAWCNGASGVGLALSEVRAAGVWSPALDPMFGRVTEKTMEMVFTPTDHCCCGNAGRLGISHTLAMRDEGVGMEFVQQAEAMFIGHRIREGKFNLDTEVEGWLGEAGFFRGLSGIGYVLLRLREPDLLPDILALRCAP